MRQITKDIQINIDGSPVGFRLTKLDAFSGVMLLRLLMRLEDKLPDLPPLDYKGRWPKAGGDGSQNPGGGGPEGRRGSGFTLLDLIASLSEDELRSVMTSVFNHTEVLLPAGPHPVMTGPEWGYPELEHDTPSCMRLLLEGISWSLSGFFGGGRLKPEAAPADTAP